MDEGARLPKPDDRLILRFRQPCASQPFINYNRLTTALIKLCRSLNPINLALIAGFVRRQGKRRLDTQRGKHFLIMAAVTKRLLPKDSGFCSGYVSSPPSPPLELGRVAHGDLSLWAR